MLKPVMLHVPGWSLKPCSTALWICWRCLDPQLLTTIFGRRSPLNCKHFVMSFCIETCLHLNYFQKILAVFNMYDVVSAKPINSMPTMTASGTAWKRSEPVLLLGCTKGFCLYPAVVLPCMDCYGAAGDSGRGTFDSLVLQIRVM